MCQGADWWSGEVVGWEWGPPAFQQCEVPGRNQPRQQATCNSGHPSRNLLRLLLCSQLSRLRQKKANDLTRGFIKRLRAFLENYENSNAALNRCLCPLKTRNKNSHNLTPIILFDRGDRHWNGINCLSALYFLRLIYLSGIFCSFRWVKPTQTQPQT